MPRGVYVHTEQHSKYLMNYNLTTITCPKCHLDAHPNHPRTCKGDSVTCEFCGLAMVNAYSAVYRHYMREHGKLGTLRGKLGSSYVKKPRTDMEKNIRLEIIVPWGRDKVRCVFNKTAGTWHRLVKQDLDVFDTKDLDAFALMCAVATYKLEYGHL